MTVKITNLVNQHRVMAEEFLKELIENGAIPVKFSGVCCPKFGNYIFCWQYNNNKLVGSILIHVNNIENFSKKLLQSKKTIDWLTMKKLEGIDDTRESDSANSDGHGS